MNDSPLDGRSTFLFLFVQMLLWGICYGAIFFGGYLASLLWRDDWHFTDYAAWITAVLFVIAVFITWLKYRPEHNASAAKQASDVTAATRVRDGRVYMLVEFVLRVIAYGVSALACYLTSIFRQHSWQTDVALAFIASGIVVLFAVSAAATTVYLRSRQPL